MITGMGYPMVGVGLNYSFINESEMSQDPMNGRDMIMPMVKITLPLYRRKYNSMKNESTFMYNATEQQLMDISNSLQNEFYENRQKFLDARRRIDLYKKQKELIGKSVEILLQSYSSSGAGLTEVLRTRQQLLIYELKEIEAVTDYNMAIARFYKLMAYTN
jgi:outer membrane protein TolC